MDYPIRTLQQLRPILVGFRKQAGLTQAAVASLLGVTQQSYAKIEANPAATSVERLFNILRLLGSEINLTRADQIKAGDLSAIALPGEASGPVSLPAQPKTKKGSAPAPPKMLAPSKNKEHW
jgi:HTH-type transcriptional regulator/antitoxin HipB